MKGVESGTRDLYEVLEVTPTADDAEIRSAFRRLAAKYHPDRNQTPHAAIHFKRVNAAFQVLGDAQRRAAYDALTGQVDPAPVRQENTDPLRPAPVIDGWYLSREGTTEGPVHPQMIVNWIASGLRDGMVRYGTTGVWHPLTNSIFTKFIPQQSVPPPRMGSDPRMGNEPSMPPPRSDPSMPPPRLRIITDPDLGKKKGGGLKVVVIVLLVLVVLGVGGFFASPHIAKRLNKR